MSLKYRDSQGNETPVAGLNGTSGELVPSISLVLTGTISLPEQAAHSQSDMTIQLPQRMPDSDYEVFFEQTLGNQGYRILTVHGKSIDTFTLTSFNADVGVAAATSVSYKVVKLMTDEDRALDEQAIASLQAVVPSSASASNQLVTESEISKTEKTLSVGGSASAIVKIDVSVPFLETDYGKFTKIDFQVRSDNIRFFISANDGTYLVTAQHNYRSSGWLIGLNYLVNGSKSISLYVSILNYPANVGAKLVFNGLDGAEITGMSKVSALPSGNAPMKQYPVIYTSDLTSTVTSGSSAPITSGGVANVAGYCGQHNFDNGTSITIVMESTAFRRVTIYQDNKAYSFIVHEWGGVPAYHWILGTELPSGITTSYSGYRLTFTNNSFGTARMIIEASSNPVRT